MTSYNAIKYQVTSVDLESALDVEAGKFGTSWTAAMLYIKELARKARLIDDNPVYFAAKPIDYASVVHGLQRDVERLGEFAHLGIYELRGRVAKLEEGSTSEQKEKPFRLEQVVFPVSYHTEYRQAEQSKMNVRLLGMVALGETTTFMEPSVLDLHLRAESDTAQRLREAVVSRKKYKLILEETEETF